MFVNMFESLNFLIACLCKESNFHKGFTLFVDNLSKLVNSYRVMLRQGIIKDYEATEFIEVLQFLTRLLNQLRLT